MLNKKKLVILGIWFLVVVLMSTFVFAACTTPTKSMTIPAYSTVTLCSGNYNINLLSSESIFSSIGTGSTIICNGTYIYGDGNGYLTPNGGFAGDYMIVEGCNFSDYYGGFWSGGSHAIYRNNTFQDFGSYFFYLQSDQNFTIQNSSFTGYSTAIYTRFVAGQIINNTFYDSSALSAIDAFASTGLITKNNVITGSHSTAIDYNSFTSGSTSNALIANNYIEGGTTGIFLEHKHTNTTLSNNTLGFMQYGIRTDDSSGAGPPKATISFNRIENTSNYALYFQDASDSNTVYNNTFYNTSGVYLAAAANFNLFYYNNFSGDVRTYYVNSLGLNNWFNTTNGSTCGVQCARGNYWQDIIDNELEMYDRNFDDYGDDGANYPYNSMNGGAVSANVEDWGPKPAISCIDPYDNMVINQSMTLCPGTFTLTDSFPNGIFQFDTDNVTLTCMGTVIKSSVANNYRAIYYPGADNVTVQGCRFEDWNRAWELSGIKDWHFINNTIAVGSYAIYLQNAANTEFRNNTFIGSTSGDYIYMYGNVNYTSILENVFNGNSQGIYFYGQSGLIINNTVIKNNKFINYGSKYPITLSREYSNVNVTRNKFTSGSRYPLYITGYGTAHDGVKIWLNAFFNSFATYNRVYDQLTDTEYNIDNMGNYYKGQSCTDSDGDYMCDDPVSSDATSTGGYLTDAHAYAGPWDIDCYIIEDDVNITENVTHCRGSFNFTDTDSDGLVQIAANDAELDCNGSIFSGSGDFISDTLGSNRTTINNCTVKDYDYSVYQSDPEAEYWNITNNNFGGSDNWYVQIYASHSSISGNTFVDLNDYRYAIESYGAATEIWNNTIENSYYGIFSYGNHSSIHDNNIHNVTDGVRVRRADYAKVYNNFIDCEERVYGSGVHGIYLFGQLTFPPPAYFYLNNSLVHDNTVNNCEIGILAKEYYSNLTLYDNVIQNSSSYAMQFLSSGTNDALVYNNTFIDNNDGGPQVDNDEGASIKFNITDLGNRWYLFDEQSEGCYDLNHDKICDSSYSLGINGTTGPGSGGIDWRPKSLFLCYDTDGDGNYNSSSDMGCSSQFYDCDDNNPNLIAPGDDMLIEGKVTLCPGTYQINDSGLPGVVRFVGSKLNCSGTTLVGNGSGIGFLDTVSNAEMYNCTFANYSNAGYVGGLWNASNQLSLTQYANDVAVDSIGYVYTAGRARVGTNDDWEISKYDPYGKYVWRKTITWSSSSEQAFSMDIDSDDNLCVGGHGYFGGQSDWVIMKFDSDGIELWNRTPRWGNSADQVYSITVDKDDNIIATGYWYNSSDIDWGIIKYDSAGTQIWNKSISWSSAADIPFGIVTDDSNNIYVSGIWTNVSQYDLGLVKLDPNGNDIWTQTYMPSSIDDTGGDIAIDADGNIYQASERSGANDIILNKYDSSGNLQWSTYYDKIIGTAEHLGDIVADSEGNTYLGGRFIQGSQNQWIVFSFNSTGSLRWSKPLIWNLTASDYLYGMGIDSVGMVYATGSYSNGVYGEDTAIVKMSPEGDIITENSTFYNNTFKDSTTGINITAETDNNIFYYNNFSNNLQYQVYAEGPGNQFNTTGVSGAQGNWWSDIFLNTLGIIDSGTDGFGDLGPDYPYNSTNGGNVSLYVADYGPMTTEKCVDADGDGFNSSAYGTDGDCGSIRDCDDGNASVFPPTNDILVTEDSTLCAGTYYLTDSDGLGVVKFGSDDVNLTCEGTVVIGNNSGVGVLMTHGNSSLNSCTFTNYSEAMIYGEGWRQSFYRYFSLDEYFYGVDVDSNDNIYAAGYDRYQSNYVQVIAKYTPDGIREWYQEPTTGGAANTKYLAVAVDTNDDIIAAGNANYIQNIRKINASGDQYWNITLGATGYLNGVDTDSSNNIIYAGYNSSPAGALIGKLDPDGVSTWVIRDNYPSSTAQTWNSVVVDPNDNIYVGGQMNIGDYEMIIAKYDSSGVSQWNWTLDPSTAQDYIYDVAVDLDENVIGTGSNYSSNANTFTVKIDSEGNELWRRSWDYSGGDWGETVTTDSKGNIYVGVYTTSAYHLLKYSPDGTLLDDKHSPYTGAKTRFYDLVTDSANNLIGAGSYGSSYAYVSVEKHNANLEMTINDTVLFNNTFSNSTYGVRNYGENKNLVAFNNSFLNNSYGIHSLVMHDGSFYHNNFTGNSIYQAYMGDSLYYQILWNTTIASVPQGNYWSDILENNLAIFDDDENGWGDSGFEYPYMQSNSAEVHGVTDYAPAPTQGKCYDGDGDGSSNASSSPLCPGYNDCDDSDPLVFAPFVGMNITGDVTICPGEYNLTQYESGDSAIAKITTGASMTCNGTIINSVYNTYPLIKSDTLLGERFTIQNCHFNNWSAMSDWVEMNNTLWRNNTFTIINNYLFYNNGGENFTFINNTVRSEASNIFYMSDTDEITIINNTFYNSTNKQYFYGANNSIYYNNNVTNSWDEIWWDESDNLNFSNNYVENISYLEFDGFRNLTVFNNTIVDNLGVSLGFYGASSTNEPYENQVNASFNTVINSTEECFYATSLNNSQIYNNTFKDCHHGSYIESPLGELAVYHNNFTGLLDSGYTYMSQNVEGSYFNKTIGLSIVGNHWDGLENLAILDTDSDGYGDDGSDYPYNSTNGGNVSGYVQDWGPYPALTCTDNDGDGAYAAFPAGCTPYPDCDDNNASLLTPWDGLEITTNITLCNGTYYLKDSGNTYNMNFTSNNSGVTCNGTIIYGNNETAIYADGGSWAGALTGLYIRGCEFRNYTNAINLRYVNRTEIKNNTIRDLNSSTNNDDPRAILVEYADHLYIQDNIITNMSNNQTISGITLSKDIIDSLITNNLVSNLVNGPTYNGIFGIGVTEFFTSDNVSVYNNTIINITSPSHSIGVFMRRCDNISNNRIENIVCSSGCSSLGAVGIFLFVSGGGSSQSYIFNNTINNISDKGMLIFGNNTIVHKNTITKTSKGIQFLSANNSLVSNNTFDENDYAIYLNATSTNNTFYYNEFRNSSQYHAYASGPGNYFNTTNGSGCGLYCGRGNYWDDIGKSFLNILDSNGDGFGDSGSDWPYSSTNGANVSANVVDNAPMISAPPVTTNNYTRGERDWNIGGTNIQFNVTPIGFAYINFTSYDIYTGQMLNSSNTSNPSIYSLSCPSQQVCQYKIEYWSTNTENSVEDKHNTTQINIVTGSYIEDTLVWNSTVKDASNIFESDITDSNLSNANVTNCTIINSTITDSSLTGVGGYANPCYIEDANITGGVIIAGKIVGSDIDGESVTDSLVVNSTLNGTDAVGSKIIDTEFCDAMNLSYATVVNEVFTDGEVSHGGTLYNPVLTLTSICQPEMPSVVITFPGSGNVVNGTFNVEFTSEKNISPDISIDGGSWTPTTDWNYSTLDSSNLDDGTHTIQVRDQDDVGQYTYSNMITITVDNYVGNFLIIKPEDNSFISEDVEVQALAPDHVTFVHFKMVGVTNNYSLDGVAGVPTEDTDGSDGWGGTIDYSAFAGGTYNLTAIAYGRTFFGGQTYLSTDTVYNITVDTNPPTGSITIIGPNNDAQTNIRAVTLNLTYSDDRSVKECRYANDIAGNLATAQWEECTTTKAWILSPGQGTKTVWYELRDYSGMTAQYSDTIEFTAATDITPPTEPVVYDGLSGYDIDWWNDNTTLSAYWWNSTEDISTIGYYYRILENGSCIGGCGYTDAGTDEDANVTGLDLNECYNYSFDVKAYNPSGLNSTNVSSDGVIIDLTDPENVTVDSSTHPDEDVVYGVNDVEFNFSVEDKSPCGQASGIEGYSWIFNQYPGTGPDNIVDENNYQVLAEPANDGYSQIIKYNGTGNELYVQSEVLGNLSIGDKVKIKVALFEDNYDSDDIMGLGIGVYDELCTSYGTGCGTAIGTAGDIEIAVKNTAPNKARVYEFTVPVSVAVTDGDYYVTIGGLTDDDDNANNIHIAGSNTSETPGFDNSTTTQVCIEGGGCTEDPNIEYAIEVSRQRDGWATYDNLPDGTYYFHVKAKDNAGNWGNTTHRKVIIDTEGASVDIVRPISSQQYTYDNIEVDVEVDEEATVNVTVYHEDGSNFTADEQVLTDEGTFNVTLAEGRNVLVARARTAVVVESQEVVVFYGDFEAAGNKTIRVQYSGAAGSGNRLVYQSDANYVAGIATENPGLVLGADDITVDTTDYTAKIFMTMPTMPLTDVDSELEDDEFLDRVNPMFGFTRKDTKRYLIGTEVRNPIVYFSGSQKVGKGKYRLVFKNTGYTDEGKVNVSVVIT